MLLVRRAEWGAPAASPASSIASTKGVKVHYLGTPYASRPHGQCAAYVRGIRESHLANRAEGYVDIAYSALVCEHGAVFEGRGPHRKTGANGSSELNAGHYAVCALLGSSGLTEPTVAQLGGLRDAIEWLRAEGDAGPEIRGHRDGYATTCPGDPLYAWVQRGAPRPGTPTPPEDDMPTPEELYNATWRTDRMKPPAGTETKENPTWAPESVLVDAATNVRAVRAAQANQATAASVAAVARDVAALRADLAALKVTVARLAESGLSASQVEAAARAGGEAGAAAFADRLGTALKES